MIRQFSFKIASLISRFLQNPTKVFVYCLAALTLSLILDGSLFHLWQLRRDSFLLNERMAALKLNSSEIETKIQKARDPHFIELQAREKFELANEGDLVFVFSDEQ